VVVGLAGLRRRRRANDPTAQEPLEMLPPEDLGMVHATDGTALVVRAAGKPDDPTIVFIHGFSLDMTTWHYQWTRLTGIRCILYDQRGHGRSAPAEDLSMRALGGDLAAVLEAVAPERPVVLVGHSMGAMAILSAADTHPGPFAGRVAGVVLVGAASSDLLGGAMGAITGLLRPRFGTISGAARRVDRLRKAVLASPTDLAATFARLTQFGPDAPPHLVDYVVGLAGRASSAVWTEGLSNLMEMDLRHSIDAITVPALVVVGEHDRVTPPSAAVELAGALPDGRLSVISGAGHLPMLERPAELNDQLRAFAAEVIPAKAARKAKRGKV
jgi:pimeloyl-ACP methyl ester carboxylesterase